VVLVGLAWLLAAITIGASAIGPTLPPPLVIAALTALLLVAAWRRPSFRRWLGALDVRWLVALHLTRFVGFYFLFLYARGQLPYAFAVPGGWGDIVVASLAVLLLLIGPPRDGGRRAAYSVWNVLGLVDILFVVVTAARLAATDPASMLALQRLPLILLPTFLVPLIIASHVVLAVRLARSPMGAHMNRIAIVLALTVLTGGCVTLTPVQRDQVAEVQQFADATTAAYKLPPIRLTIEPATNLGIGGRYRQGNFYLNETQLTSGGLTALVAHELAHYVLGHDGLLSGAASTAEAVRMQEERELDANAKAVEILVRVKGLSERQALTTIVVFLERVQIHQAKGNPNAQGHRSPAEEIADLKRRFPSLDTARPPAPGPVEVVPVATTAGVPAPVWKAGDQWTFWWASPAGSGTFRWTIDREESSQGEDSYVIKLGTQREFFVRRSDLAVQMEKTSGEVTVRYTPPEARYPWPLALGAEREVKGTREEIKPPKVDTRNQICRVEGEESLTVQAGTFRSSRVVCRNKPSGQPMLQLWYSPEVKNWIKEWRSVPDGVLERELISYTLR